MLILKVNNLTTYIGSHIMARANASVLYSFFL
ncbi:MAG: hypothetical protein ACI9E5_001212, partial [Candidatus Omnitrophota bacterium]